MPKFYYLDALKLMSRTLPCLLTSLGAHGLFALAMIVYFYVVFWLITVTQSMPLISAIIFFGAFGGSFWWYRLAKHYALYLIKAGHVAVMAELLVRGKLPEGVSQVTWGKEQVTKRFVSVSAMSAVDVLLQGIVKTITNTFGNLVNLLPLPEIDKVTNALKAVVRTATSYIDEAILARAFVNPEESVWKSSKDGVILYAMCWRPILANAAGLALAAWASFGFFLLLFSPVGILLSKVMPDSLLPTGIVLFCAYLGKVAISDTFAIATTMVAFHKETAGVVPDAAWDARLSSISEQFKQLKAKVSESMSQKQQPPAAATTPEPPAIPTLSIVPPAIPAIPEAEDSSQRGSSVQVVPPPIPSQA